MDNFNPKTEIYKNIADLIKEATSLLHTINIGLRKRLKIILIKMKIIFIKTKIPLAMIGIFQTSGITAKWVF